MNREHLIYTKAIEKWGVVPQLDQTIEECAELIQAVNKFKRKGDSAVDNLIEEIIDVEIMIGQVKIILEQKYEYYAGSTYAEFWKKKLRKISKKLKGE